MLRNQKIFTLGRAKMTPSGKHENSADLFAAANDFVKVVRSLDRIEHECRHRSASPYPVSRTK
jgi:hypothetical protein